MSSKPVLSICMIVKDEEQNLPRCLESLQPVLDKIDAELIIVDTGSTDSTPEIAKKHNAKLFFNKWNNSFSDMRNKSISYAKGEWIFIIDADEEIENPEKLVFLLNDDILKKFPTIRVKEKNLTTANNKELYILHVTERLFKNDGQFMYRGSVHNQPVFKQPILDTNIMLVHYGYIAQDSEMMEKKFKRTGEMLKKELNKNPENVYYRFQLARSFSLHNDRNEALNEIRIAYNVLKKNIPDQIIYKYYVLVEYAKILFQTKRFDESITICKEGIDIKPEHIDWYFYQGYSCFSLQNYNEGYQALKKYFEIYNEYEKYGVKAVELYTYNNEAKSQTAIRLIKYLFNKENYEEANNYLQYIENKEERLDLLIRISFKLSKYKDLNLLYLSMEDEAKKDSFVEALERERGLLDDDEKEEFDLIFAQGDCKYSVLAKIRSQKNKNELIGEFLLKYSLADLPINQYADIVKFALAENKPFLSLFRNLENSKIKKYLTCVLNKGDDQLINSIFNALNNTKISKNDFYGNRVLYCIAWALIVNYLKNDVEQLDTNCKQIFKLYIDRGIAYICLLYQTDRLRLIYSTLDKHEEKFLILMHLAQDSIEKNNLKIAIRYYKEAIDAYPYFSVLLEDTLKTIQIELTPSETNSREDKKETLKIIQGTMEIANQMNTLSNGFKKMGIYSKTINYYPSYLGYQSDYKYSLKDFENKKEMNEIISGIVKNFDIFHFHFGTSLYPDNSDLPLLKSLGKKTYMHHWGSDVRMYSLAKRMNKYTRVKTLNEDIIKKKLHYLSQYIENCIVADYELYEYVKDYYSKIYMIPQALDLDKYVCKKTENNNKLLIVHAPTSPEIKGTEYIMNAINELQHKYDFEFKLIQNLPHEEAKNIYNLADIIIDQVLIGSYGLLSIEAMAMGKPVIAWISDFMKEKYPKELPIISSNPDTIYEKIEMLIKDDQMRNEIGHKGREYVEKHHDVNIVCKKLVELYN